MDFLQLMMKAHNFQDEDTPEEEKVVVDMKRELTDDEVVAMVNVVSLKGFGYFLYDTRHNVHRSALKSPGRVYAYEQ